MKRIIEPLKTALIIFLVVSMLLLWVKNMQLRFLGNTDDDSSTVVLNSDFWIFTDSTNAPSKTVANPDYFMPVAVTLAFDNTAYTSAVNKELTQTLWKNELPLVNEVFSSSYVCEKATAQDFKKALQKESFILIDFPDALPYSVISAFSGKSSGFCEGELCLVKSLLLYPDENDVVAALAKSNKNEVYSFKTTVDKASSLIYSFNSNNLAAYTVNKGFIEVSFDSDTNSGTSLALGHKTLLSPASLSPIHIENPISSLFEEFFLSRTTNLDLISNKKINDLLTSFGINPATVGVYTDANSRLIFINADTRLVISQKGKVEYAVSNEGNASITLASLLESERTQFSSFEYLAAATAFLDTFKDTLISDTSDLLLEKVTYSDGKTTFHFNYYNNLCPVICEDNTPAVKLVFDKTGLIEAVLTPLAFSEARELSLQETSLVKATVEERLAVTLVQFPENANIFDFKPIYVYEANNKSVYPIWAAIVEGE